MKKKIEKKIKINTVISCIIAILILLTFNILNYQLWDLQLWLYFIVDFAIILLWVLYNFIVIKIILKKYTKIEENGEV